MFSKFFKLLSPIQWGEILLVIVIAFVGFNVITSVTDNIKDALGFETKENLKEKTINQSVIIEKIEDTNKDLIKTIDTNNKSNEITKKVIIDNFKSDLKLDNDFKSIEKRKRQNIERIKVVYDKEPITIENTVEMERQVSTKQITSLWESYCLDPDNSLQCEINKNV